MSLIGALESVMRALVGEPVPMRERVYAPVAVHVTAAAVTPGALAAIEAQNEAAVESLHAVVSKMLSGVPQVQRSSVQCSCAECLSNERGTTQTSDPGSAPGLVRCGTCGTNQAPRGERMAVHFATRLATRPCAGSWPAKSRAA